MSGNTPTNSAGSTDEDEPVDKNRPVTASPSRRAVVRTEEEENLLNEDGGEKTEASDAEDGADETAEDELSTCNNQYTRFLIRHPRLSKLMAVALTISSAKPRDARPKCDGTLTKVMPARLVTCGSMFVRAGATKC